MEFSELVKNYQDAVSCEDAKIRSALDTYAKYLRERLEKESSENNGQVDPILKSMSELMDLAVECDQCQRVHDDTYEDVTKVLRVRISLSKKEIERLFNIKPVSVYGIGLFLPVDGLMLTSNFRKSSGYDDCCSGKKGASYSILSVPDEVVRSHEFRLSVPAMGGLFVPKKCHLMNWISSHRALQFFDLTLQ